MKRKLSQAEIDKLVTVDRIVATPTSLGGGVVDVDFFIGMNYDNIWQYKLWQNMLYRAYCPKYKQKFPTYVGVTVCSEWLYFGNFLEWVNREVGYGGHKKGFALDKDLLIKGNKVYCPEACSFVPDAINLLLGSNAAIRGGLPIGVSKLKGSDTYRARLKCWGSEKHLGCYKTPAAASAAYKIAKEAHVKVVATQHRDSIKPAVYEALMNWKVEE
jgi:hypothetical protein